MSNKIDLLHKRIERLQSIVLDMEINEYLQSSGIDLSEKAKILQVIEECKQFYSNQQQLRNSHFGYPANLKQLSPAVRELIKMDAVGYLSNNCGDNSERGNYQMDSKDVENRIIKLFAERYCVEGDYWGYITSGGSESNLCGIDMAFSRNPNAILYFCEAAHYSIMKHSKHYHSQVLPSRSGFEEQINAEKLVETARLNFQNLGKSANIVLTFGTTKVGACDDIPYIVSRLSESQVPFYLHVDAALYGGLPKNQIEAPIINSLEELKINSISLSFHKYIGYPKVKSLILATQAPLGKEISYIGQRDTSASGSRDILPFSLYEHIREVLHYSKPEMYCKNVRLFEKLLIKNNIEFTRVDKSNIFVIDEPSQEICKRFQLSTFKNTKGENKAHIIIFPYHSVQSMKNMVASLCKKS